MNCRLAVWALLTAGLAAYGQPVTALSGIVLSQTGKAVAGAQVTAKPASASEGPGTRTDASGRFTFRGLEPGVWDVAVEAPGHYPAVRRGAPVSFEQPFEVEFRLAVLPQGPEVRSGESNIASVQIFYATDRKPSGDKRAASFFTGTRALGVPVSYGTAEVTVPYRHKTGELERPASLLGVSFEQDPAKHFVLQTVSPLREDVFSRALARQMQKPLAGALLVFVHGYNNTFEEAALRLAQLWLDLDFRGVPVLFSWPSTGTMAGYKRDEGNVEWATFHFQAFLEKLATTYPDRPIFVIAHSMGSRALSYAVRNLSPASGGAARVQFAQIVLAAPDIDSAVFRELAASFRAVTPHVTLYVSADDFALQQSQKLSGYPRAGQGGADRVLMDGVDTVECTGVDTSFLAHSYFAETVSVVSDVANVLAGVPPAARKSLSPHSSGNAVFYEFRR